MTRNPITVRRDTTVGQLCDLLQEKNINGAPVVDEKGRLLGVVTQEDIIYGAMGHPDEAAAGRAAVDQRSKQPRGKRVVAMLRTEQRFGAVRPAPAPRGEKPFWAGDPRRTDPMEIPVGAIMTSPAISADEETPVFDLCRIMWSLRIHRIPILKSGKVTGLVSSMDLCRAILEGTIRP
jgi:CBS domain-containing protein